MNMLDNQLKDFFVAEYYLNFLSLCKASSVTTPIDVIHFGHFKSNQIGKVAFSILGQVEHIIY
jgi:hypothetical protein